MFFALSSWDYIYYFEHCSLTEFNLKVSRCSVYDGFVIHDSGLKEVPLIEEIAQTRPLVPLFYVTSDEAHSVIAAQKGADGVIIKEGFSLELFHALYQFTATRLEKERGDIELAARINQRLYERSDQCNVLTYKVHMLEEERAKQQKNLEQLERVMSLGQMTSSVVHDFRNLLTALYGGIDMLKRRIEHDVILSTPVKQTFALVVNTIGVGRQMAQGLLDFASEKTGQKPEDVQINYVIEEMEPLLGICLGKSIQFVLDLNTHLPAVTLSRNLLERALLNLATNARDAMAACEVAVFSLKTTMISEEGQIMVALIVEDTGPGMRPDILKKACEPFFSTKPPGKGTGLGLAQIKNFAEQSQGRLCIENKPQKGLRITLFFPCAASFLPHSHASIKAVQAYKGQSHTCRKSEKQSG